MFPNAVARNEGIYTSLTGLPPNRPSRKTCFEYYTKTFSRILNLFTIPNYLMKSLSFNLTLLERLPKLIIFKIFTPRRKEYTLLLENNSLYFKTSNDVICLGQVETENELLFDICTNKIVIELNGVIFSLVNNRYLFPPPSNTDFSLTFENMSSYKICNFEFE
jgi:hypothetical protein